MSFSVITTAAGGAFPGGGGFPSFNFTPPDPRLRPSANTTSFITKSSTITIIASNVSSITFSTTGPTITVSVTPVPATSSDVPLLESNASLTRTNIIITLVLGGVAILLLVIIAILLGLYIRQRRREREDNSPPFTSLAARSPTFARNTTQSAPQIQLEDFRGTSLSMGPQRNTYGQMTFTSHPLNRPLRSFSAPAPAPQIVIPPPTPVFEGVPAVNVQPNTPSVFGHDGSGQVSPISQPGPSRMPMFREELHGEHPTAATSSGEAGRLGIPAVAGGQRASVSTMGSDMGFEHSPEILEERGNARGVLHSTRASSGVFPEP